MGGVLGSGARARRRRRSYGVRSRGLGHARGALSGYDFVGSGGYNLWGSKVSRAQARWVGFFGFLAVDREADGVARGGRLWSCLQKASPSGRDRQRSRQADGREQHDQRLQDLRPKRLHHPPLQVRRRVHTGLPERIEGRADPVRLEPRTVKQLPPHDPAEGPLYHRGILALRRVRRDRQAHRRGAPQDTAAISAEEAKRYGLAREVVELVLDDEPHPLEGRGPWSIGRSEEN